MAQRRELEMKKRQSSSGPGMIRSSLDGRNHILSSPPSISGQFTPAMRQFSTPKSVSLSQENSLTSEFKKSKSNRKM